MAFPDDLLAEQEDVAEHLHPHPVTLVPAALAFLLTCAGVGVLVAVVPHGSARQPLLVAVLVVAVVVVAWWVVRPLLRWATTHYVLTTDRVLVRSGVLARSGRDIALSRIVHVDIHRTPWDRVVGSGTLSVHSGAEHGVLRLHDVPRAAHVQQLLDRLLDAEEHRRHASWR